MAARCGELLEQIAGEHGWEVVAKGVMPDHVDLFVRVGPTDAPARVVRAFKGRTARMLRAGFALPWPAREGVVVAVVFGRLGRVGVGVGGAPLHRASVGCGGVVRRACVLGCVPRRGSTSRWRRVWKLTVSCTTRRCKNAGMGGRRARPA